MATNDATRPSSLHAYSLALATGRRASSQQNRFQPTWESLDRRPSPAWYPAAKFGIFVHWNVYSVPAYAAVNVKDENPYAEWYWHSLTEGMKAAAPTGHGAPTWKFHQRVYGARFPYFGFAPLYRAELYDPDRWADVFVRSGAKYVALTAILLEGGQPLEAAREGSRLRIRIPELLAASLPARQAYVLKIAGAR
jgi:alpha-L-fucosidase